jgi:6-pyruvoyltetrahydropterin/6-carboxytetrahydropterin synthase
MILCRDDTSAIEAASALPGQKLFLLDSNPTAENMASYLLHVVSPEMLSGTGVRVESVTLWETENCFAEAKLEGATQYPPQSLVSSL